MALAILAIPDGASTCAGDGRVGDSWGIGSSGIGPKLGDPKFTTVQSTEYTVFIYFLVGGFIFLECSVPAWKVPLEYVGIMGSARTTKRLLCLSVPTSEPLPGLCRACARVQANRAEEISAGADWEIKRSLNQNPIWSSRFFTHFYDEECPEAFT